MWQRFADVDEKIILKWDFEKWDGVCMGYTELAHETDRWWIVVNVVLDLWS
jgi:hypothetical protein